MKALDESDSRTFMFIRRVQLGVKSEAIGLDCVGIGLPHASL